jgi:hypothetical protein
MAGLAWSAPVSCVARSMRGTRAAQRADTHRMRGAYGISIRTQLYLQCYCACRRHQGCHWRENGDFGTSAFFGQLSGKPLLACI